MCHSPVFPRPQGAPATCSRASGHTSTFLTQTCCSVFFQVLVGSLEALIVMLQMTGTLPYVAVTRTC